MAIHLPTWKKSVWFLLGRTLHQKSCCLCVCSLVLLVATLKKLSTAVEAELASRGGSSRPGLRHGGRESVEAQPLPELCLFWRQLEGFSLQGCWIVWNLLRTLRKNFLKKKSYNGIKDTKYMGFYLAVPLELIYTNLGNRQTLFAGAIVNHQ